MTTKAIEQMKLSGKEMAAAILARLNEIILEKMSHKLIVTPGYYTERGVNEPHYKLSLDPPPGNLEEVIQLSRRHAWLPTVREVNNDNMFWITFILLGEDLDPSVFDNTGFSYSSRDVPHEWSTDDAANHIYEYLSTQVLDGDKFE